MKNIITMDRIIAFVVHPTLYGETNVSSHEKRRSLGEAVLFYFLAMAFVGVALVTGWFLGYYTAEDLFMLQSHFDSGKNVYLLLSLSLLFAPVLEEIGFRGILTINKTFSVLSLSLLTILILNFVYQLTIEPRYEIEGWMERLATGVILLIVSLYLYVRRDYINAIIGAYTNRFLMISVLGFSLIHLGTYLMSAPGRVEPFFLLPMLALYAALGIALSYVRVKCGIGWAMGLHAIHNGIMFSLLFRHLL